MKLKNLILIGAAAAGAFWLLSRFNTAQANTGTSYGATITTTDGERLILRDENGVIRDQNGGIWA